MAVAAVSRDTMRSFSPPAATPVTVSVTATLLLAGWACACKGKPGAAKGRVVLAGGLAAERGFEQLGGGGGV